jgi:ketosteroid isomerase-like protein
MVTRWRLALPALFFVISILAGCSSAAPVASRLGSPPTMAARTSTPQPATDEEAIRQLILAEGQGVVSQDIAGLMDLWAAEAVIADAKHTPADPTDDARWTGRDAIRERYVVLVFPGNPLSAGAADVKIEIQGDKATAISTTVIGSEISPGGDRWTFARRDGRWWITGLTYNLEPK